MRGRLLNRDTVFGTLDIPSDHRGIWHGSEENYGSKILPQRPSPGRT